MTRRDPTTVEVTLYDCPHCGATDGPTYHDGDRCEGPVLHVGGEWRCGGCGGRITPADSCFDCGRSLDPRRLSVPLDLRPRVAPRAVEQAVHKATNARRRDHGVAPLSYSDHLAAVALCHSRDMATRGFFDHTSPDGEDAADRYRRLDHDTRRIGENIAFRQPGPAAEVKAVAASVVEGWMESRGHRENLLRDRFDAEGIGVFATADGTVYVTQNFR
jgi:hypothetical protein